MLAGRKELIRLAQDMFADELANEVARDLSRDTTFESALTLGLGDKLYDNLGVGEIRGLPTVTWNGMDAFVHYHNQAEPFSYVTSENRVIIPRAMETDGGSIPRLLRSLQKFSSWGYAPAFVIHDWLFVAKRCNTNPDNDWSFEDTAWVMAEVMKTLTEVGYKDYFGNTQKLEKSEDTILLMYLGVRSSIARRIWDSEESIRCL